MNCLFAAGAQTPSTPSDVHHETAVPYAGKEHPDQVMDVFTPTRNVKGRAMIVMVSGGFVSHPRMLSGLAPFLEGLARSSGYTFFAVTHRGQPQCVIGEIVPQAARAVRFIRYHAGRFKIDPARIGALGFSSGGHLALMVGVRDGGGPTASTDPVDQASSRVQAVAAFFPPTDFLNYGGEGKLNLGDGELAQFRPAFFHEAKPQGNRRKLARAISPRTYVSASSAPTLLIHGDADSLVPIQQSRVFQKAMKEAGAPCRLRVKPGQGHGWPAMDEDLKEAFAWFDHYLIKDAPAKVEKHAVSPATR